MRCDSQPAFTQLGEPQVDHALREATRSAWRPGDDHSHLPVADPWFQPRRRAVILCPLPDQSLGEPVDPPSMATSFAATKPDSAAGMVPSANAEQFAYPHRCAGWELGRV